MLPSCPALCSLALRTKTERSSRAADRVQKCAYISHRREQSLSIEIKIMPHEVFIRNMRCSIIHLLRRCVLKCDCVGVTACRILTDSGRREGLFLSSCSLPFPSLPFPFLPLPVLSQLVSTCTICRH